MSIVVQTGAACYTSATEPDLPHQGRSVLHVENTVSDTLIYLPVTPPSAGASLISASLTVSRAGTGTITPNIDCRLPDSVWLPSQATFNDSPNPTGPTSTDSHTSTVDVDPFTFDVVAHLAAAFVSDTGYQGFQLVNGGDPLDVYSFDSVHPPTLTLVWETTPAAPTNLRPSGGRAVATATPILRFDAADVTAVQVQIDTVGGTFTSPLFDSGTVVASTGRLDLSTTAYGGLPTGTLRRWRARYKNSAGTWSPWSTEDAQLTQRPYAGLTLSNPNINTGYIVNTDTPTIAWTFLGSQTAYRVQIVFDDDPATQLYDTGWVASTVKSVTIPDMVIRDSSDLRLILTVRDQYDRESVPGYPADYTGEQVFSFQETGAVAPPDQLIVNQLGHSPFVDLSWNRTAGKPDSWQIRIDSLIVAGQTATADLQPDDEGWYHWRYFNAAGGDLHHARIEAKVGDQVSSGGPTADFLTQPTAVWIGDPNNPNPAEGFVEMFSFDDVGGDPFADWDMGEINATYYPLRGSNAVTITQTQRGYEGAVSDGLYLFDDDDLSITSRQFYRFLMDIKATPNPQIPYVLAFPYLAFSARLKNIVVKPFDDPGFSEAWKVTFGFEQIGDLLWVGREAIDGQTKLLLTVDYEEGTDGAAVTTTTQPYAHQTGGAPKYESDAAVHGVMGMRIPAAASGGWVSYPAPYIGQVSIYFTPRTSTDKGALFRMDPFTGVGNSFFVVLKGGGDLAIADGSNTNVASSHGVYGWVANRRARLDCQWTWSPTGFEGGPGLHVVGRLFTQSESSHPADEWEATFACTSAPGFVAVGNGTSTKSTDYDTIRVYAGNSTWPDPLLPGAEASVAWSLPAAETQSGFSVNSRVFNVDTIQLAVSTSISGQGDPVSPDYYDPDGDPEGVLVSPEGLVSHTADGYDPGTVLYAKLSPAPDVFIGDLIQVTLDPAPDTVFTTEIGFWSCQTNAVSSRVQLAWEDMLAWGPAKVIGVGDIDYVGGQLHPTDPWQAHLELYTTQILGVPAMKQMLARAANTFIDDDHAFSDDNGESNESTDTGKVRAVNILALQKMFPSNGYADTRDPSEKRGLYWSRMLGNHIRLIVLDAQTLDRSLGSDTDNASKTFAGAEQDAWLRSELVKPAAVNIIVTQKALLGTANHSQAAIDKPPNYSTWRANLASFIDGTSTTDGKDINVYWWGGDRHFNAYVSKDTNPITPGHPALVSSGIEMNALSLLPGEDYDDEFGDADFTLKVPRVQYLQITITDTPDLDAGDGSGTVTIAVKSRQVEDTYDFTTHQVTDPSAWVVVDGFSVSDTWDYTAQPGEVLAPWAGDATQSTVEISAVTSDAWSVGLQVSVNSDMSAATTYASAAPTDEGQNKWSVTGLPAGHDIYYRFTDTLPNSTVVPIGDIYHCRTLFNEGADCVVRIAAGSCARTAPASTNAFNDIVAWAPHRFHHLGDLGYPGYLSTALSSHRLNWARNVAGQGLRDVLAICCMDYTISDHDDNGSGHYWPGGNGATKNDVVTKANIQAWAQVVPARMEDTRALPPSGLRARYRAEVEGRVRYLKLDTRSLERDDLRQNGRYPANDPKPTMLGATQLAWVKGHIDAAVTAGQLVVIFTDPSWNGSVTDVLDSKGAGTGVPISYSDKWPTYYRERDDISDYAAAKGAQLFIICGDSHLLEQDDGTNEKNGFAVCLASPLDQEMHAHFQDSYEWNYPNDIDEGGHHYPASQMYQRFTFTTEGNKVTVLAEARDCTSGTGVTLSETVNGKQYGTLTKVYHFGSGSGELEALDPGDQTGTVGDAVSLQLHASGGTQPYGWSAFTGPAGTSMDANGHITGTLTTAATTACSATVTDDDGNTSTISWSWLVNATVGALTLTDPGDQSSKVGDVVSLQMSASGGVPPYAFTATGLPHGVTQRRKGKVTGSPTTVETDTVVGTVTDSASATASVTYGWTVTQGDSYVPPDGSITPDTTDGATLRKAGGVNPHANFTSYQN